MITAAEFWKQWKEFWTLVWEDFNNYHQPPKELRVTAAEQEAIDQIKEVISTALSKFPANATNCTIKIDWALHETENFDESFMRPNVEITYSTPGEVK